MSTDDTRPATPALTETNHQAYHVTNVVDGAPYSEPAPWSVARLRALLERQSTPPHIDDRGLLFTLDNGDFLRATPAPAHFDLTTCTVCSMFEREHWSSLSCRRYNDPGGRNPSTYLVKVQLEASLELNVAAPESAADLIRALAAAALTVTTGAPGLTLAEFRSATLDLGSVRLQQVNGQAVSPTCQCGNSVEGNLDFFKGPWRSSQCVACASNSHPYQDEPPF
ncbi:hypothetical protein [Streptomyces mirabilis]|uniref:hypothetical protein n=1 Tax=Streptomyces mirabilis TaxID=68239 RepID=UPI0033E250B6